MTISAKSILKLNNKRKQQIDTSIVDVDLLNKNLSGSIDDQLLSLTDKNKNILSHEISDNEMEKYLDDVKLTLKSKGVEITDHVILRELACRNQRIGSIINFRALLWDPEENVVSEHSSLLTTLIAKTMPFGRLDNFTITQVKKGHGPAVLFINGFLSENEKDSSDWESALDNSHYVTSPCYLLTWDSGSITEKFLAACITYPAVFGAKLLSSWYDAMTNAQRVGSYLSYILQCTDHEEGFVLMGHSLGARVIYYLLEDLSKVKKDIINSAYLLGGAVDHCNKDKLWDKVSNSVKENIYNLHSENDDILKLAYQSSTLGASQPIGLYPINAKNVINIDVSKKVSGHTKHKENFSIKDLS